MASGPLERRWLSVLVFYVLMIFLNGLVIYEFRSPLACRLGLYCPVLDGEAAAKFQRVQQMYQTLWSNGTEQIGSQLVVYHHQQKVIDLVGKSHSGNDGIFLRRLKLAWSLMIILSFPNNLPGSSYSSNSLQTIWSCTKVVESLVAAMCVDRGSSSGISYLCDFCYLLHMNSLSVGVLDYNAPIAKYWPEFAQNGKENGKIEYAFYFFSTFFSNLTMNFLSDCERFASSLRGADVYWRSGREYERPTSAFRWVERRGERKRREEKKREENRREQNREGRENRNADRERQRRKYLRIYIDTNRDRSTERIEEREKEMPLILSLQILWLPRSNGAHLRTLASALSRGRQHKALLSRYSTPFSVFFIACVNRSVSCLS